MIAGIDEAGRGPLAGPVVAAAVILDPNNPIAGLMDSKKLTAARRAILYPQIKAMALSYAIAEASVEEIEEINILQASLLAMQRALNQLSIQPSHALVDGVHIPKNLSCSAEAIIKGDEKEEAISAASILAKVYRDERMVQMDKEYPLYGFAQHKGYGTKLHLLAIQTHGPCVHHRMSFRGVK